LPHCLRQVYGNLEDFGDVASLPGVTVYDGAQCIFGTWVFKDGTLEPLHFQQYPVALWSFATMPYKILTVDFQLG